MFSVCISCMENLYSAGHFLDILFRFYFRQSNVSCIHFKEHIFFIGRGLDYAAALEGALKLKEISYIHAEAYAAGELKHGTLSLIENKTPVIALATQPALYEKILSNTAEVICRGADLFALTDSKNNALTQNAKQVLLLPKTHPLFAASLSVIPLQLFAYYVSLAKGVDVDKPRNLAKSVTVE